MESADITRIEEDINRIAALAEPQPKEEPQKKEPPKGKKRKKEQPPPSPEEISAAVAKVVLAEMQHWPEEVVALIGEQHPKEETFIKGVSYVIGVYMHLAREALENRRAQRKREAQLKTTKLLSPVAVELQELRLIHSEYIRTKIAELNEERKKRIKKVVETINRGFDKKVLEVKATEPSERILKLTGKEVLIKEAYAGAEDKIDKEANELLAYIQDIEENKDDWNSKDRQAKRMEEKETPQEEQKAVE